MKKYVFFPCTVFGVGGGQLYVANKAAYLKNKGYEVITASSDSNINGDIFYNHLNSIKNSVFKELKHSPDAYTKKRKEKIIQNIIREIGVEEADEIVLESNTLISGLWAERIAERIGAKHIVFSVSEHCNVDEYMSAFLDFKFRRGELATISVSSFENVIRASSLITEQNLPILRAYLGDPIEDVEYKELDKIEKSYFNICIMGRGEKRYVEYACKSLAAFCKKHPDSTFSVALISQFSVQSKEMEIRNAFNQLENVKCYFLGYLNPIPRKIFTLFDLYIGGAGCASLFYRQKVLTLAMDLYNDRPLGFMGYDTCVTNAIASEDNDMESFLEDAFFKKEYLKKQYKSAAYMTAEEAFSHHDYFLQTGSKEKSYFIVTNRSVSLKKKIGARFPFLVAIKRKLIK